MHYNYLQFFPTIRIRKEATNNFLAEKQVLFCKKTLKRESTA